MQKIFSVNRNVGRGGQSLADGQVGTSIGTIYTCPDSIYTMLRSACFYNTNAASQTLEIYITRSGGTRRQIYNATVAQDETFHLVSNGEILSLSPGDVLEAQTTTGSAVDYVITGQVEDA